MDRIERMRAFITKVVYYALWVVIFYCLLKYALPLFMPFVIAFFISFVLRNPIRWISEKTRLNRRATAVILLTLIYLVIGTLLTLAGVKLVIYLREWFAQLPGYYRSNIEPALSGITIWFDDFIQRLDPSLMEFFNTASANISSAVSNIVSAVSSGAISVLTGIAGRLPWIVVSTVLCIITSYFFVVDYHRVTHFIIHQMSESTKHKVFSVKDFVVNVLFKFVQAYAILIVITFAEVTVGLLILRVSSPVLVALVTAIVDILPVLGTGTIMLPWALFCLITGDIFRGIGLIVLYVVITIIRQAIEPRIVGRQIGLYPLLTLICMFIGARLFGFWGMFGFPITLTVIIHLNRSGEIHLFKE